MTKLFFRSAAITAALLLPVASAFALGPATPSPLPPPVALLGPATPSPLPPPVALLGPATPSPLPPPMA